MWKSRASLDLAYHRQWPGGGLRAGEKRGQCQNRAVRSCTIGAGEWKTPGLRAEEHWALAAPGKSILATSAPLGRLTSLSSSHPSPGIRACSWSAGPPAPQCYTSGDKLSEELRELVTLTPSGFQMEASLYRATVDWVCVGWGGIVFSIENFNTRPSFHCITQNTKMVLGE